MHPGNFTVRPGAQGEARLGANGARRDASGGGASGDARNGARSGVPGAAASRVLTTADVLAELLDVAERVRTGRHDPAPSAPPPAPTLPPGPVTLARLLERHGADFVVGAYADLLGRPPDPDALEYYRVALVSGRLPKAAILGMIRYSPEGRRRGEPVPGLRRRFLLQRTYRLPVLGQALRMAVAVLALPRLLRDVQRLEQQNALTQERIAALERSLAPPGAPAGGPGH